MLFKHIKKFWWRHFVSAKKKRARAEAVGLPAHKDPQGGLQDICAFCGCSIYRNQYACPLCGFYISWSRTDRLRQRS